MSFLIIYKRKQKKLFEESFFLEKFKKQIVCLFYKTALKAQGPMLD